MSSNNLLSMLARGQEARGNSLSNRQGASPTFSFMPRSASRSLNKNSIKVDRQISVQLLKIAHLINVKVKKEYFFSFCKL